MLIKRMSQNILHVCSNHILKICKSRKLQILLSLRTQIQTLRKKVSRCKRQLIFQSQCLIFLVTTRIRLKRRRSFINYCATSRITIRVCMLVLFPHFQGRIPPSEQRVICQRPNMGSQLWDLNTSAILKTIENCEFQT
ncbi:unnamed protein product [Moneuplotes crassus]|uniref:Uncharacterized protein n=1 Tax=Euplotes crassus TaxID=5936 RepID=A0AAD1UB04_EUPCR|nr:unnamed protein product [Moneuplotes crassus]